jgi:hypothetical protein
MESRGSRRLSNGGAETWSEAPKAGPAIISLLTLAKVSTVRVSGARPSMPGENSGPTGERRMRTRFILVGGHADGHRGEGELMPPRIPTGRMVGKAPGFAVGTADLVIDVTGS